MDIIDILDTQLSTIYEVKEAIELLLLLQGDSLEIWCYVLSRYKSTDLWVFPNLRPWPTLCKSSDLKLFETRPCTVL